ncbi:hypothetical protein [Flavobacterium oreochromis]|uniref:hypothetical protein n=1 Tax=Flavobacterium oreochromis TaxID=2906078 RepID=UPI00385EDCBE
MSKKTSKLGSYSNDGLASGFNDLEFSENDMIEMRKIVDEDFKNIEIDLKEQLLRLDDFLKKTFGALFKNSDFVKWFFDKKKINQWGKNIPKITDDELIQFSYIYINELNDKAKKELIKKSTNNNRQDKIWLNDEITLTELANFLKSNNFIENDTIFIKLFLNQKTEEKTNWIKYKTTLIYLISKLQLNNFISDTISVNGFIENHFYQNGNPIKNTKQSKEQMNKPHGHKEIDLFINEHKNTLP